MQLLTTHLSSLTILLARIIKTPRQLEELITETWLWAVVILVVALLASWIVASSISYSGSANPQDGKQRRTAFWGLGVAAPVLFFLVEFLYVKSFIAASKEMLHTDFMRTIIYTTFMILVLYIGLGFVLSKMFSQTKYGTIFNSKD